MNNATPYRSRDNQSSQKTKAEQFTSPNCHTAAQKSKGQRRLSYLNGKEEHSTSIYAAHDFLRNTFLPKVEQEIDSPKIDLKADRQLQSSSKELQDHFCFQIPEYEITNLDYKWNLCLYYVGLALDRRSIPYVTSTAHIEYDEKEQYHICVSEQVNASSRLFYVPVLPLKRLLSDRSKRKGALLLQAVFSFLYLHAELPFYTADCSFLNQEMEYLYQWSQDAEDEEVLTFMTKRLSEAMDIGCCIWMKISNPQNLTYLQTRLTSFKPKTEFDAACFDLAQRVSELLSRFETGNIFKNASPVEEVNEYETHLLHYSFSFIPDLKGGLYAELREMLDSQLQECYLDQSLLVKRRFDGRGQTDSGLAYEILVLALMEDLIELLLNF